MSHNWGPHFIVPSEVLEEYAGGVLLREEFDEDLLQKELDEFGLSGPITRVTNPWYYRKKNTDTWVKIGESDNIDENFPVNWDTTSLENGQYEVMGLMHVFVKKGTEEKAAERRRPGGQGWRTFLRNHAPEIAAMDLFIVPTIGFNLLYALVIVRLDRRQLVWIAVTTNPTAEWVARQITEAFPWNEAPRYLIRNRDGIYGAIVTRRLSAMGIRDKPIAPASPWQNGCRTAHRIDPARVSRPCYRTERSASAQNPASLCALLQQSEDTPITEPGCAGLSPDTAGRVCCCTPNSGRSASSL